MAKVVVVTSGKGGVGKTTSTAALGAALAQFGQNVVVVDFDVGLRNLDLVMGAERRVVYDLINVTQGIAKLPQALIRDKRLERLALLPASQTRDKDALTEDGVARVINSLKQMFDWVICNSPAGIERGATLAMRFADTAIVVTNPEVSSVRDSDRIIGILDAKTVKPERGERVDKHLLISRYDPARAARGEMLSIDDVLDILSTPLLGIIPESEEVLRASNLGSPVTFNNPSSAPARAYLDAARRLMGEEVEMTVPTEKQWDSSANCSGGERHEPVQSVQGRRGTAPIARDRLQILLAYERGSTRGAPDLLAILREGDPRPPWAAMFSSIQIESTYA
jgi:septum site-determining protein MinD